MYARATARQRTSTCCALRCPRRWRPLLPTRIWSSSKRSWKASPRDEGHRGLMARTIRFHLDEHCPAALATGLRRRGMDVTTTPEAGLLQATDLEQLAYADA